MIVQAKRNVFEGQKKRNDEKIQKIERDDKLCHRKKLPSSNNGENILERSGATKRSVGSRSNRHERRRNRQNTKAENTPMRRILRAPKWAAQAAIRGEIGISNVKSRIARSRLLYLRRIETGNNEGLNQFLCFSLVVSLCCLPYIFILYIKSIILLSILNSFSICTIFSLFIESYAFLKSIAIATICSFFLCVSSTHSLRINRLSKIFQPLVNPACSNFPILFSAMCFSISLPISDISILYNTSVIAIGLSSVSVCVFFFGITIIFDFFHSDGLCFFLLYLFITCCQFFCHLLVLHIALLLAHLLCIS